jgi:hypothetical protein
MSPLLKNLIIALTITVVLLGAYILFTQVSDTPGISAPVIDAELQERSQQILRDTNTINAYRVDTSILSDRRFTSLQDTRINLGGITLEPRRSNPFAPTE